MEMKIKFSRKPVVCYEDESVFKAISRMERNKVKALPVVDKKGRLKGIFSEYRILYQLKNPNEYTKVKSAMQSATSLEKDKDELQALNLMVQTGFETIPVVVKDKVVGIISDYDMLKKFKDSPLFKHMLVTDIMYKAVKVKHDDPISKARDLMKKNRVDSLPVYKRDDFIGVAVARRLLEKFLSIPITKEARKGERVGIKLKRFSAPVETLIERSIKPISDTDTLSEGLAKLLKYNLSSLPILKGSEVVGFLRRMDIMKLISNKLKSKDIFVNVSGKVSLEEARAIIEQVKDRIKKVNYLFKNTRRVDIYIKRPLIKHYFIAHMYLDNPRLQVKYEGKDLMKTIHDTMDKVEEILEKELRIKKSRKH